MFKDSSSPVEKLINESILTGVFPNNLKQADVTTISKWSNLFYKTNNFFTHNNKKI